MYNFKNINEIIAHFKKMTEIRIDDKFLVVHPKHYDQIKELLDKNNIIVDIYAQDYCDIDKVYLIDKITPRHCQSLEEISSDPNFVVTRSIPYSCFSNINSKNSVFKKF